MWSPDDLFSSADLGFRIVLDIRVDRDVEKEDV